MDRDALEQQWVAICGFLDTVTVPLIKETEDEAFLIGGGTFFAFGDSRYFVTAAHVLRQHGIENVGVPENARAGSVHTFGSCTIRCPELEKYDVAVIRLEDREFIAFVSLNWRFLGLENIGSNDFGLPQYLVAGYPNEYMHRSEDRLGPSSLLVVNTRPFQGEPENRDDSGDFYLEYSEEARDLAKNSVRAPTLPGLSGTSVWKVFPTHPAESIWTVEENIRVVGIQCAYKRRSYIRVASWWLAQKLIKDCDTRAGEEISHVLRSAR